MEFKLNYQSLINMELGAKTFKARYFAIAVSIPNLEKPEIIVNPLENIEEKMNYYLSNYDDELKLIHNPAIQIVGITFGDSFEEIEKDLIY